MKKNLLFFILISLAPIFSCQKKENSNPTEQQKNNLTIFFVNDVHAQINNFAKLKHLIDKEKLKNTVIVASSGDMFSGNPVVDFHTQKGFPIIDVMNQTGFNVSAIGNHEYDYGQEILAQRISESDFSWLCANVNTTSTNLPQPPAYTSIVADNIKVTFLGLVETGGSESAIIPSTHPLKLNGITFERAENIVKQYSTLKTIEKSDLYIALSHLGHDGGNSALGDFQLARQFPYFDLIIGGHSHADIDTVVNGIPVFQAKSYLNYVGKIELVVENKHVKSYTYSKIDLNAYPEFDPKLKETIDQYNDDMAEVLNEVIGTATAYHSKSNIGCFYTDAIRSRTAADVSFQNTGGVRSDLDKGNITVREIYEIDPFNNGTMIYDMTVGEITTFLKESGSGFYYSGIEITQSGSDVRITLNGKLLERKTVLKVGINDYVPAVHPTFFPPNGQRQNYTTAEAMIYYLRNTQSEVNYRQCNRYFRYDK